MSAHSNLGDAPWTHASTDPAVRREWAAEPLAMIRRETLSDERPSPFRASSSEAN
jgi:hypothetical protein